MVKPFFEKIFTGQNNYVRYGEFKDFSQVGWTNVFLCASAFISYNMVFVESFSVLTKCRCTKNTLGALPGLLTVHKSPAINCSSFRYF